MKTPIFITAMLVFLAFSAFFSATEIAFTSLNKLRLEKMAEKSKAAKVALSVSNRFNVALSTILIGNNLVNTFSSSVATAFTVALTGNEATGATIASVLVTVVVLIFGEILPKVFAKQHALSFACRVSLPIAILMVIFRPITLIVLGIISIPASLRKKKDPDDELPTVTEEELATIIETAEEEGVIDEVKSELVQSALSYSETTVEDILSPRIQLDMINIDEEYEAILEKALTFSHSRIPVYEGTVDHIIGILSMNRFFRAVSANQTEPVDIRALMMEPCFVHKTMKLPAALNRMRAKQLHLVVVLDEYGGTMGIVTMEDILEQIVGDIWDESDTIESDIRQTGENSYDVDGMTPIDDFFDNIDMDTRDLESEYTTMGGWAIEMLESEPHEGDSFTYKNLSIIVTEMRENLVGTLSIVVNPISEEEEEAED
jgi:CBS domain containing-hemolysin-like protein